MTQPEKLLPLFTVKMRGGRAERLIGHLTQTSADELAHDCQDQKPLVDGYSLMKSMLHRLFGAIEGPTSSGHCRTLLLGKKKTTPWTGSSNCLWPIGGCLVKSYEVLFPLPAAFRKIRTSDFQASK